ncbi:MAG: nitrophenyl compound nitroreductase subunit ArsF family protein [Dehalococcoidia bacterium]
MFKKIMYLSLSTIATGLILLGGCSTSSAVSQQPAVNSANNIVDNSTVSTQPPDIQPTVPADNSSTQKPALLQNRVDVIYFHMNQRCVTCLCFEQHVNHVIETYFTDAIDSGRLTYQVLNAQLPENAAIARKYKVVGSQLFTNSVVNGFDNIEDIQDIWNWDCRNNPGDFELKVRDAIELRLQGLR